MILLKIKLISLFEQTNLFKKHIKFRVKKQILQNSRNVKQRTNHYLKLLTKQK